MMAARKKNTRWFFPTNTNNLRMIFAQGMLTSPTGYSKYYEDCLSDNDGYLPLFKDKPSTESVNKALSEADHLIPCLLEIDLSCMEGQVNALTTEHNDKSIELGLGIADDIDDIQKINIPLPLPLGTILKVIFKDKADIKNFEQDVSTRSNVILNALKLSATKADEKLFATEKTESQLPKQEIPKADGVLQADTPVKTIYRKIPLSNEAYSIAYAYGGLLTLLFYNAKNGAESENLLKMFLEDEIPESTGQESLRIPRLVHQFFFGAIDETRADSKMIKGVIRCCIESDDFKNSILNFLNDGIWDEKAIERAKNLAETLQNYASTSSLSVSDYFARAKSDTERILLMLFTREDSNAMIEYSNQNIEFSEQDYGLFSLFFGIRDKFVKSPVMVRKYAGLQLFLSYKMAEYLHKKVNSSIRFKEISPPKTVWQFVDKKLTKSIAKLLSLESCIETIMPKAEFKHEKGRNIYRGYYEPAYELVSDKYFKIISSSVITDLKFNKLK